MKIEVAGVEALRGAIRGVKAGKVKAGLRKGSRAGCKIIAARAKQLVPRGSGRSRKAIKVRALPRSRVRVGTQVRVDVAGTPAYYFAFVELGTVNIRPRGYVKEAVKQTKAQAGRAFVDGVAKEITK